MANVIYIYRNGAEKVEKSSDMSILPKLIKDPEVLFWLDMQEPSAEDDQAILADFFQFHPLTVEDTRATRNQPKIEQFPDYLFFIVHGVKPETDSQNFVTKELDGYLACNYLITYHHETFRSIDDIKRHLEISPFALQRGTDYLLHQILDQIVDLYVPVAEDFDQYVDELEDRIFVMKTRENEVLEEIMDLKRNVMRLKRISSKQVEVIYRLSHAEFPQIKPNIQPFFRDVYDHLLRVTDMADSYRDLVNGLLDVHFSIIANRTNEVMKLLAVFSAIMLPLSLIAGIYGMNFENMPELHTRNGYFITLALMASVAIVLMGYFWYKGWILQTGDRSEMFAMNRRQAKQKKDEEVIALLEAQRKKVLPINRENQ